MGKKQLNSLQNIGDLQRSLADALTLGYSENTTPEKPKRVKRSGPGIAAQLCGPGCCTKVHEKALKAAYLVGYEYASIVFARTGRK